MNSNDSQMQYYKSYNTAQTQRQVSNTLFVADLPDECCEEDLSNFFHNYNFIVAKVVHNILNTHAFVILRSREDAEKARNELNGVKLEAKYATVKILKPVRICKYEIRSYNTDIDERCNLLVKNLSKEVSAHLLFNTFKKYGDIKSSKLMVDYYGNSKCYGFISYYKVENSLKAKEELNNFELLGKKMKVNILERGRVKKQTKNNLYVKHFPKKNFENKDLEKLFTEFGEIKSAIVLKDEKNESKGFGFVCFNKAEDAEKALNQMNNKKLFDNIENNLYVSFAMKKGERKEILLKKKEELFKMSQKMTVYAKIKNENDFENKQSFEDEIKSYLKTILGENFKPKYLKISFESKNAFITMNNQKEAENFVKKYQEITKDQKANIYFNLYKSRVDRMNAKNRFKTYNQYSETNSLASSEKNQIYKTYNNFNSIQSPFHFNPNNNNPSNQRYIKYNDFNTVPNQIQPKYQTYNDFNNNNNNIVNEVEQNQLRNNKPKLDYTNVNQVGDYIFEIVDKKYSNQAGKITGMLIALDPEKIKSMIENENELLENIEKAHNMLQNNS
jgi:RNA recognition motif-containing protein